MKTLSKSTRALSLQRPERTSYEVGYAKPPLETRFKKGQSGNPRGRPRGSRNKRPALHEERLREIILDEAYRMVKLTEGGRQISIPIAQAVIRSLALLAAKGQPRAQRLFTQLVASTEADNRRSYDEWVKTAIDYKIEWEQELVYREETSSTGPEPLLHPKDVIIDIRNGGVRINGPMTTEEKKRWDKLRERKAECASAIAEYEQLLREDPNCPYKEFVIDEIEYEKKLREMISRVIPDE